MRGRPHYATVLVVIIAIAALGFALWHSNARSDVRSPEPGASTNNTATPSPTSTENTSSPSPSSTPDEDGLVARSTHLIEQYFLLEPTDTPQTRQARLELLRVPEDVIAGLDLTTGTLSCSDQTRLNTAHPLVQRAVVVEGGIERTEYQDTSGNTIVYLAVPIQLSLYRADNTVYTDDSSCVTSSLWAVGLTWIQATDDTWQLTSLVSPEGGSL